MPTRTTDAGHRLSPEGLWDLLSVVNSSRDLDHILAYLVIQAQAMLGSDGVGLYLRDPDDGQLLRLEAAHGVPMDVQNVTGRIGWPIIGMAVSKRRTIVVSDFARVLTLPHAEHFEEQIEDRGSYLEAVRPGPLSATSVEVRELNRKLAAMYGTMAAVPLLAHDEAYGTLMLYYHAPNAYGAEQAELSLGFAQQAALAIENTRLRAEAERRVVEIERRHRVARGMRDLLASVNSTRSLDEVLNLVLAQASDLLGSDAGSVLLLDNDGQTSGLTVRASRGLVPDIVPVRLPVGTAITGVAVERGQPVAVSDLLAALPVRGVPEPGIEQRHGYLQMLRIGDPAPKFADAAGLPRVRDIAGHYRALLAVPLVIGGAITLYYRQPREFSGEDIKLALAFADQTALAIDNARLHAQTVRRSRELEALYRADDVLYRSLDLDDVLQALADVAIDIMDADMTAVLVWDAQHTRLIPGATSGFRPEIVAQMSHAPGDGISTRVALSGQPIAVEDATRDPRVAHRITSPEGIQSLLHVPIKVNDEVFGVFAVNYRQQRTLTADHERILVALAHRAAVAIANARLYAESERRRHDLEALYRADEALHRSLLLDDVLRALVEVARDVFEAEKTSVHIWDAEHKDLVIAAAYGCGPETLSQPLVPGEDVLLADLARPRVLADFELVGEAENGTQAVRMCAAMQPDVILMDLVMPEMDGVATTRAILARFPHIRVIVLTSFPEDRLVHEVLAAGALSYLLKNVGMDELARAIRAAQAGQSTLAPEAAQALIQRVTRHREPGHDLSPREREVLALMVQGLNNPAIAERLVVGRSTIKFHVSGILSKLGVESRTEAVALAVQHHLV